MEIYSLRMRGIPSLLQTDHPGARNNGRLGASAREIQCCATHLRYTYCLRRVCDVLWRYVEEVVVTIYKKTVYADETRLYSRVVD